MNNSEAAISETKLLVDGREISVGEARILILKDIFPTLVENLLTDGKLDQGRLSDLAYVWKVILEAKSEYLENAGVVIHFEDQFIQSAKDAASQGKTEIAIVLVVVAIEHRINLFIRDCLEYKAWEARDITEIIRSNSLPAKVSLVMRLISDRQLTAGLKQRVLKFNDLRNSVVHYKGEPSSGFEDDIGGSFNWIQNQLKNFSSADIDTLSNDLDSELESILHEISPNRKLAQELTNRLLSMQAVEPREEK